MHFRYFEISFFEHKNESNSISSFISGGGFTTSVICAEDILLQWFLDKQTPILLRCLRNIHEKCSRKKSWFFLDIDWTEGNHSWILFSSIDFIHSQLSTWMAQEFIPKNIKEFSSKTFWNDAFEKSSKPFDWYGDWHDMNNIISHYLKHEHKILIVGCGNSSLGQQLYFLDHFQFSWIGTTMAIRT